MALLPGLPVRRDVNGYRPAGPVQKKVDPFYQSPEWKALRVACFKRDGYRCVECGERAIIADHIKRRRDGGPDTLDNLRSLCRACDNRLKETWSGKRRGSK